MIPPQPLSTHNPLVQKRQHPRAPCVHTKARFSTNKDQATENVAPGVLPHNQRTEGVHGKKGESSGARQ
jgi:hypothetical protein